MSIQQPRRLVPTDQGHADVINAPIDTLYNNDLFLAQQIIEILTNPADHGVVSEQEFQNHINNAVTHITAAERSKWDASEANAKKYTDDNAAKKSHTHAASDLPSATTQARGIVQLSTSTVSTAADQAATPSAVKAAMDRANEAFQSASNGKTQVAAAITGKGVPASGSDTFPVLAQKIGAIQTTTYGAIDINRPGEQHQFVPSGTRRFIPLCQLPASAKMFTFRITGDTPGYFAYNVEYSDGQYSRVYVVLRNIGGSEYIRLVWPQPTSGRYRLISLHYEYATNMVFWVLQRDNDPFNIRQTYGEFEGVVDLSEPVELCFYHHVYDPDGDTMPILSGIVGRLYYA